MSDSVWPHRLQPTRLPCSWDSPSKNTGVGCHFLLQCMKVKIESEVTQSCPTLSDPNGLQPSRLLHPWDFPGQNTEVGGLSLFQEISPTQGSNSGLWHCRWILYQLSNKGSRRILERVAYPFSRGSSQPRNWKGVSCIAGGFFTSWATREAQTKINQQLIFLPRWENFSFYERKLLPARHTQDSFFVCFTTRHYICVSFCLGSNYFLWGSVYTCTWNICFQFVCLICI